HDRRRAGAGPVAQPDLPGPAARRRLRSRQRGVRGGGDATDDVPRSRPRTGAVGPSPGLYRPTPRPKECAAVTAPATTPSRRSIFVASFIGTSIEWYDY